MENKQVSTPEEIKKEMQELINMATVQELLQKNEITFTFDKKDYRIKKPNFKQKQEAYSKRIEKFTELLSNDKYKLENDLKTVYLKRNIDINKMDRDINTWISKRDGLRLKLGEAIKNQASDNELEAFKKELEVIMRMIQQMSMQKMQLLEFSIENQVSMYTYSYLTFLVVEIKNGDNYEKLWKTFEEYEAADNNLLNVCSYYTTLLNSSDEM
jgi:predicted house-cleaning noncanonical NTP pyrophosphatase (MazG superfamily)